eukprot:460024_1
MGNSFCNCGVDDHNQLPKEQVNTQQSINTNVNAKQKLIEAEESKSIIEAEESKSIEPKEHKIIEQKEHNVVEREYKHDLDCNKIVTILHDYDVFINENELNACFDQYDYTKQQLISDLSDAFDNKNDNNNILLSQILSNELHFTKYKNRKKIYDLLLHSYIDIKDIPHDDFIKILLRIIRRIAPDANIAKCIEIAQSNKLSGKMFLRQSPEFKHSRQFAQLFKEAFQETKDWNRKQWAGIYTTINDWKLPKYLKIQKQTKRINEILKKHQIKVEQVNNEMINFLSKFKALHNFTANDIQLVFKWWIYNDVKYKKRLSKTMKIFSDRKITESVLIANAANDNMDNIKNMLETDLKPFMTEKTFEIMLDDFLAYLGRQRENSEDITDKKYAEQLGYDAYNFVVNELFKKILDDQLNGQMFIEDFQQQNHWIQEITGWEDFEIYQIQSVLFKYHVCTESQLQKHMKNVLTNRFGETLSRSIQKHIKNYSNEFKIELEELYYKIKNGQKIQTFSDMLTNMIDELVNEEHKNENYDNEIFIREIYEAIVDCFVVNDAITKQSNINAIPYNLESQQCWQCAYCSNNNFNHYIDGKINNELLTCSLCGITRTSSIIAILKDYDTYLMLNDRQNSNKNHQQLDKKDDANHAIDLLIQTAQSHNKFDLTCLTRNDNHQCPAILRMVKNLIIYKKWMQTIDINKCGNKKPMKIDISDINTFIEENIDDQMYKDILLESAQSIEKISKNNIESLQSFIDNVGVISKAKQNWNNRKAFRQMIIENTNINRTGAIKIWRTVKKRIQRKAEVQHFGNFLTDLDINTIDKDYHHIVNAHLHNGNRSTLENVFKFFGHVVHYDDTPDVIQQCRLRCRRRVAHRRYRRTNYYGSHEQKTHETSASNMLDTDIWSLRQDYMQNSLDIIHSYLVHTDWKHVTKLYGQQFDEEEHAQEDEDHRNLFVQNQHKYVTNLTTTQINHYRFGIDYQHPYLKGKFVSIRDEMLFNNLYPLSVNSFDGSMANALKKHKIALDEYKNQLICKYYKTEFNIIRNEPISIRHMLAILFYTDNSLFCTAFRESYRRINNETTDENAKIRHRQFYNYARALYEAVEFFGSEMTSTFKVYHGLDRVMYFSRFTTYWNQPISTTKKEETGLQFADGTGIVLVFKSGIDKKHSDSTSKIPKYLPVSWCSAFPYEEEQLFYGENVCFEIHDIIEANNNNTRHCKELTIMNRFQKMLQNEKIEWNEAQMNTLTQFIQNQQHINVNSISENEIEENEQVTHYGQQLFGNFCNNVNTNSIQIRNYHSLPNKLTNVLFRNQQNKFSLIQITNLFQNLDIFTLTDLNINHMKQNRTDYVNAASEYVQNSSKLFSKYIKSIIYQSQSQLNDKPDSSFKTLIKRHSKTFKKFQWDVKYVLDIDNKHNITFINTNVSKNDAKLKLSNMLNDRKNALSQKQTKIMDKKLSFFLQVTSINEKHFHIELIADKIDNKMDRTFKIKEKTYYNDLAETEIEQTVTVKNGHETTGIDVEIKDSHSNEYHLALYEYESNITTVSNTNQIQLMLAPNKLNQNYKPKPIDVSSIFKVKDMSENVMHFYWAIPSQSYGSMSYKIIIIDSNENKDELDEKQHNCIEILPYSIPFTCMPISFKVITMSTINNQNYQSEPSQIISVGERKQWNEYPNLLQIVGVDEDSISIKFTLITPTKTKKKYRIQEIDGNNKISSAFFGNASHSMIEHCVEAIEDTTYVFAVFLNGKQISNIVCVQTAPKNVYSNIEKYLPNPPSTKSIEQYYDEHKENVLVIWDHPNLVFGDEIMYKIQASTQDKFTEITELPYKISASLSNGELKISTISIINNKRYEGPPSDIKIWNVYN